ncbi:M48 family metallopeptidase [bacterium]|nr:M48 family metallopeptidase [bacterium]MBU1153064.1 M48 family metallopeptidase [bacterium]MBU1782043.1 M48 family metallopeptidase [bacterium]
MKVSRKFNIHKRKTAKEYSKLCRKLNIIYSIFYLVLLLVFLISEASLWLEGTLSSYLEKDWLLNAAYFFIVLILFNLITLPTDFHVSFVVEHKFNLSNQSIPAWILENIKKTIVSLVIGLILIETIYYFLRGYPNFWWVYTSIIFTFFSIILSHLAPLILIPLFYKLIPIEDEILRNKLINLCQKMNISVKNVYKINLSKETKKANAGLTGIGNTRCVILSDTLLEKFSHDEIEVVFAHELGHHYYEHLWKLMGVEAIASFVCFYLVNLSLKYLGALFGLSEVSNIANLPLLILSFSIISFIFLPLKNSISRIMEKNADKFALEVTLNPLSFISSMITLGDQNLSEIKVHPFIEAYFFSHPSLLKRIKMGYSLIKVK